MNARTHTLSLKARILCNVSEHSLCAAEIVCLHSIITWESESEIESERQNGKIKFKICITVLSHVKPALISVFTRVLFFISST